MVDEVMVQDIYVARRRIASVARRTPLILSPVLTERAGASVYLKLENLQETGSFKMRGAANKMLSLTPEERARGVIAEDTAVVWNRPLVPVVMPEMSAGLAYRPGMTLPAEIQLVEP